MFFVAQNGMCASADSAAHANVRIHNRRLCGVVCAGGGLDLDYAQLEAEMDGYVVLRQGIGLELYR